MLQNPKIKNNNLTTKKFTQESITKGIFSNFFGFSMISAILFYALGLNMEKISISLNPTKLGYEITIKNIGTTVFTKDSLSVVSPPKITFPCQNKTIYNISNTPKLLPSEKLVFSVSYESCPRCNYQIVGRYTVDSIEITEIPPRNWRYLFKNSIYVIVLFYGLWLLLKIVKFIAGKIFEINPYLFKLTEPATERRNVFNRVVKKTAKNKEEFKMLAIFYQHYVWENMQPSILHIVNNWENFEFLYCDYEHLIDNNYYYENEALRDIYIIGENSPGHIKMIMFYAFQQLSHTDSLKDIKNGKISLPEIKNLYTLFYKNLNKDYKLNTPAWHWMEADLWLHEDYKARSSYYKYFFKNTSHLIIYATLLIILIFYFGEFLIFEVLKEFLLVIKHS